MCSARRRICPPVDEISAVWRPIGVWFQLASGTTRAPRGRGSGIAVVQDRCISVEHRRLAASFAQRAEGERRP
jgi:predicted CoA-binding protein